MWQIALNRFIWLMVSYVKSLAMLMNTKTGCISYAQLHCHAPFENVVFRRKLGNLSAQFVFFLAQTPQIAFLLFDNAFLLDNRVFLRIQRRSTRFSRADQLQPTCGVS